MENKEAGYVLIIEDDPDIRGLLSTALSFQGYQVESASNGKDGLDIVQKELPRLVITDIMMPQLDGFGLVHRLRLDPKTRNIPVVFITATYVTPEDKDFALSIGATRFVQKPVEIKVFLNLIAELLQLETVASSEPLDEFEFYDGYRRRLEAKLEQKTKQIAREELLLSNHADSQPEPESPDIQVALRRDFRERDELKLLLDHIHKYMEKFKKPEETPGTPASSDVPTVKATRVEAEKVESEKLE